MCIMIKVQTVFRLACTSCSNLQRFSIATAESVHLLPSCRTRVENPVNHSMSDVGLFYTMSPEVRSQLFHVKGLKRRMRLQADTFNELALMVREPAVEIMECMKAANYLHPVVRYVLYGRRGVGKTQIICHLLHYGLVDGWILVHAPGVQHWLTLFKEIAPSDTEPGWIDTPFESAVWLQHFKNQNSNLLENKTLVTSKDYVWSKRETTPAGSPLISIVELGISRNKYSSYCIYVLLNELKQLATDGRCKVLVAVINANAFFYHTSRAKREDRSVVAPLDFTIIRAFLQLLSNDWKNGAVIMSVAKEAVGLDHRDSHLPRYLLGKKGFEYVDPFIPVGVDNYTEKEVLSCLSYYMDRRWIQNPRGLTKAGIDELRFLSSHNPFKLSELCESC